MPDAISSCYRATIPPGSTSLLSAAEAAARLAKFLRANRDRLLKLSGEEEITRSAYREAIALRPDQTHGERKWLKFSVFRDSIFPDAFDSALRQLVTVEVIQKSKAGLVGQQQRVPGLNLKEYFYVIDSELRAFNRGKDSKYPKPSEYEPSDHCYYAGADWYCDSRYASCYGLDRGDRTGDDNNTAVLSNFGFGGGAPVGTPSLIGGATGDAGTSITITESSFFNQFIQEFTPGNQLDFHLALTTNLQPGGVPDEFTFSILDSTGSELPTQSFFDLFVEIDINSSNPTVQTFASDPTQSPAAGGPPIDIAAPTATPSGTPSIPEPGSLVLLATALSVGWLGARRGGHSRRSPQVRD